MYLFDTNILSELRKIPKGSANLGLINWLQQISSDEIYTSVIVLMELERGVLRLEHKDMKQGAVLRNWLQYDVMTAFRGKILNIDETTARICAQLHFPHLAPENDAWIAATAIQHNLILVTRNTADFEQTGVQLLNPFVD